MILPRVRALPADRPGRTLGSWGVRASSSSRRCGTRRAAAGAIVVVLVRGAEGRAVPFVPRMAARTVEFGRRLPCARGSSAARAWVAAPRGSTGAGKPVLGLPHRCRGVLPIPRPPAPEVKPTIIGRHVSRVRLGRLRRLRHAARGREGPPSPAAPASRDRDGDRVPRRGPTRSCCERARVGSQEQPVTSSRATATVDGVRSRRVVAELRCPKTDSYVRGCLGRGPDRRRRRRARCRFERRRPQWDSVAVF